MSIRIRIWMTVMGLFSLSACAGMPFTKKPQAPAVQPVRQQVYNQQARQKKDPTVGAGLWSANGYRGLFQDLRAAQIGDLVTVNIVETSKANKKANTKSGRQSSIEAGISNAMGWETKLDKVGVKGAFDNENMFKGSMKNDFSGSGETSRDESMTASITARVIDVMPDGNLLIRGSREIKVNNETQFITLSGLIRPSDISPDNTVLSSYIADAKIAYTGSGPISDKQRPGWLTRTLDFVWPF